MDDQRRIKRKIGMKRTIVAIDPGAGGGIAVFTKNKRVSAVNMPDTVPKMKSYFEYLKTQYDDILVFIEKVQAWNDPADDVPGKKFGINKMLENYSALTTTLYHLGLLFVEVYPVSWQSRLNLKAEKGTQETTTEKKNRHKEFAQNAFPEINPVTHKIADALCILQFAMWMVENQPSWVQERIKNKPSSNLFN